VIIDPYHPEQWNNAKKIEEMGAGIVIFGDTITKERLGDAISRALAMTPPDLQYLFFTLDGCEAIRVILENLHVTQIPSSKFISV
jgi:UDP:flavonoid glycosyltransferase YjiC (YdhE family)